MSSVKHYLNQYKIKGVNMPCTGHGSPNVVPGKEFRMSYYSGARGGCGDALTGNYIATCWFDCGTRLAVTYRGRTVVGIVKDQMAGGSAHNGRGCACIDVSPSMFSKLTGSTQMGVAQVRVSRMIPFNTSTTGNGSGRIVRVNDTGNKIISTNVDGEYPIGTRLYLKADPGANSRFDEWGGEGSGSSELRYFVVSEDLNNITAKFTLNKSKSFDLALTISVGLNAVKN